MKEINNTTLNKKTIDAILRKIPYKYYYDDTYTNIDKQMQQYENQLFNCRDGETPDQRARRLYWARKYIELKYLKHKK